MSKRLARILTGACAVLIAGAMIAWGGIRTYERYPDNAGAISVTGATTNYTLNRVLLPSPTHDSTWHVIPFATEKTVYDSVLYTAYYDTLVFDTRQCDRISVWLGGDFDSLYYWLDYSIDGKTWTSYRDSTFINGTPARGFPPDHDDWSQKIHLELDHIFTTVEGGATICDTVPYNFAWPHFRMRLRNEDRAAVWQGDTTMVANAAADTAINVRAMILCGD